MNEVTLLAHCCQIKFEFEFLWGRKKTMIFLVRVVMLNMALYVYVHDLINIKFYFMPYLQIYLAHFRFDWDESYLYYETMKFTLSF